MALPEFPVYVIESTTFDVHCESADQVDALIEVHEAFGATFEGGVVPGPLTFTWPEGLDTVAKLAHLLATDDSGPSVPAAGIYSPRGCIRG